MGLGMGYEYGDGPGVWCADGIGSEFEFEFKSSRVESSRVERSKSKSRRSKGPVQFHPRFAALEDWWRAGQVSCPKSSRANGLQGPAIDRPALGNRSEKQMLFEKSKWLLASNSIRSNGLRQCWKPIGFSGKPFGFLTDNL